MRLALAADRPVAQPPPGALRFFFENGSAKIFAHAEDVDLEVWSNAFGESHKDFEYYRLIEQTILDRFTYRYLVLFDADERAIALQPLIIVDQDLTASINGRLGRAIKLVRRRAPRFLHSRMLMAGCLVGDGKLGLLPGVNRHFASALLAETLARFARSEGISLIVIKDFQKGAREELLALGDTGFTRLDGFPSLSLKLDFDNFDHYMQNRLTRVTRKGLRRKLKKAAAVVPKIELEVLTDCSEVIDEIYPLYLNVAERSDVTFETFTKEYFVEAGKRMPGRFRYFVWRHQGKAVAFCFCMIWGDTIYDNDIGLDYSVAHELNLYYLSFHDIIEWALQNQMRVYESAPFNYETKLHLRLRPRPLDLYIRHMSPLVNFTLKYIAPMFAPAKSDLALRKYLRGPAAL